MNTRYVWRDSAGDHDRALSFEIKKKAPAKAGAFPEIIARIGKTGEKDKILCFEGTYMQYTCQHLQAVGACFHVRFGKKTQDFAKKST